VSRHPIDLPVDAIAADYIEGHSQAQLAELYGVSSTTILRRLRAAGVTARRVGCQPRYSVLARRLRMRESGMSVPDIARRENVTNNAVYEQLRRHRKRQSTDTV
jgi:transposase